MSSSESTGDWESAAALYRGPFLSGTVLSNSPAFDDWQQSISYDLERRYLEILGKLVHRFQSNGTTTQAIDYANRYLAVDELAETIHCSLITLFAASGRRTDALQQYSLCVDILHHELGVEPLPETRAAFEAARDGTSIAPPRPKAQPNWSTLPGLDLPLTGRDEAWRELKHAHQQRQSGGVILISGAPGIGKSRLMQEFASRQSSLVLVGNCHTGSQALSYQPLVQALRQGLQDSEQIDRVKAIWLAELSVLLPELRDQNPDLPDPLRLAPDQAQARILEALTQVFHSLARSSRLLLCLDDLHAADEGTLAWLNYAAGRLANSKLCLLVTFRIQEAQRLAEWRRTLSRTGLGSQIRLQALPSQSVEALLKMAGTTDTIAADLAARLHKATGGNAFFLLETIRELLESSKLETQAEAVPLPQTVREAVLRRADRLDPLARQILDMAAILSPLLDVPLLSEASARSELEAAGALDELVLRQFLLPANGRFTFQHDLTREAVYGAISDWRLRLLHQRVAQTLEQQPQRVGDRLAIIAAHYAAAEDYENATINYYQAAVEAQRINSFHIAASYLGSALELLPQISKPTVQESDLQERLGDCQRLTGHFEEALERYQKALESTKASEAVTRARVLRKNAETLWPINQTKEAIKNAQQALHELSQLLNSAEEAAWQEWLNVQFSLVYLYYWDLNLPDISSALAEIEPILSQLGDAQQKQRYRIYSAFADFLRYRYRISSRIVAEFQEDFDRITRSGDLYQATWTEFHLSFVLLWAGELASAEKHFNHSLRVAEDLEVTFLRVQILTYLQILQRLKGNLSKARELWPEARGLAKQVGSPVYLSQSRAMHSWLAYKERDWALALVEAEAAVTIWDSMPMPFQWPARWVLLAIALDDARLEDAIGEAQAMTMPSQHLQTEPVNAALESAVALWDEGETAAAQEKLKSAVKLAEKFHYL